MWSQTRNSGPLRATFRPDRSSPDAFDLSSCSSPSCGPSPIRRYSSLSALGSAQQDDVYFSTTTGRFLADKATQTNDEGEACLSIPGSHRRCCSLSELEKERKTVKECHSPPVSSPITGGSKPIQIPKPERQGSCRARSSLDQFSQELERLVLGLHECSPLPTPESGHRCPLPFLLRLTPSLSPDNNRRSVDTQTPSSAVASELQPESPVRLSVPSRRAPPILAPLLQFQPMRPSFLQPSGNSAFLPCRRSAVTGQ